MTELAEPSHPPDHIAELIEFTLDWWKEDVSRLLPGEQDDHTVYLIDFYDRCRYFGFTKELVFYRAASLAANIASWGTNSFVEEHAARVPYAIRCIKSGLNDLQARRLRNMLVAQAPENVLSGRGSVVQTPTCWLMRQAAPHPPMLALQE